MSSSLEGCVSSLRSSMQLLDTSINILGEGVNDFPRLSKVLNTTRHFEIISEPDLQAAQSSLLSEIRPEVESLFQRVNNYLDKLERREQSLIAKCDLNEGRLGGESTSGSAFRPNSRTSQARSDDTKKAINAKQEMKYKQLRQRKQRLSYAVETLELQAKQRERQLRMSMAAPQQLYED
ncbi:DASH complex subunit Spc19 [Massariosphaeria phaeospora]|uniref:DASH complex subunit SPC19 n=1 Tax=Massariosphaeria phaeospora TaxID=100035 RepID=A0A7C8I8L8_9PLEO|nr:DASH complex subunit Spc19 [Massariosphaeria phaeospora]